MRLVSGLRRRGVDISCALEEGLLGESDERQLEHAAAQGRVVVSSDADFLRLAHQLLEDGKHLRGALFILPGTSVGDAVRGIALVAAALEPDEMRDWIEWIS